MTQRHGGKALPFGLAIVVAAAAVARADSSGVPVFTHGVASGDVTATSAILWTQLKGVKAFQQTVQQASAAHDFTVKVDATGLAPGTT